MTKHNTWVAALSSATMSDDDLFTVIESGTTKKVVGSAVAAYVIDELHDAAAVGSVVAGYDFVMFDGTDEKLADVDLLAAYVVPTGWTKTGTTEADPAVSGDMLLARRSSTIYTMDVDTIAAYTLAGGNTTTPATAADALDEFLIYKSDVPKLLTIEMLTAYTLVTAWGAVTPTITTLNTTDTFLVGQSAVSKKITLANIETQIVSDKKATILNIYGYDQATLAAADEFLVNQSNGASIKKTTLTALETKLYADLDTHIHAATDVTTVTATDEFYVLDDGSAAAPKKATALEIATYVTTTMWAAPTNLGALTGTDTVLTNRSATMYESTLTEVATFCNASAQATVLNISGLDHATIAGTDFVLVCQTATGKHALVSELATFVLDTLDTYTTALAAVTEPDGADLLYCLQSGTAKKLALTDLASYLLTNAQTLPWTTVLGSKWTGTPLSTSSLTMSDTSDMKVGLPLKYTIDSAAYYGIVTAVAANTSVTIAGAPLGGTVTDLSIGIPEMVCQLDFDIQSLPYATTAQDLLTVVESRYVKWQKAKAHLVAFSATHHVADTGVAQPKVNVKVAGNLVSTEDSNKGIQLSATPGTWVDSSAVALNTSYYDIDRGDAIDIRCTTAGTNGDADCLAVSLVFVYE